MQLFGLFKTIIETQVVGSKRDNTQFNTKLTGPFTFHIYPGARQFIPLCTFVQAWVTQILEPDIYTDTDSDRHGNWDYFCVWINMDVNHNSCHFSTELNINIDTIL